jgi:nicotinamidase/pyrazinamidase
VAGAKGADFHRDLDLRGITMILRKGFRPELDSYSAFFENDRKTITGLDAFLRALSIDTLVLGGLATDYCVLYSALDARTLGYRTIIAGDACRGVGHPAGSVERAKALLLEAGAIFLKSEELKLEAGA